VLPHAHDVGGSLQVTVADDRNIQGLDHPGDLVPVSLAGEHLGPGAGMQGKRSSPGFLHAERNGDGITGLIVPAASGLYGNRQMGGAHHGPDDLPYQVHVSQAAGAAVTLHHLLDRAAEVDVDELGLVVLGDQGSGLCHGIRISPVDLDADGALDRLELGTLQRGPDPAPNGLRAEKLGEHEVGPHSPADLAERRLGYTRHGGENQRKRMR
jgi:hypothetical protein